MLHAFNEVSELPLALQSESTTLNQAYKLVRRCIRTLIQFKEGHNGEHTKTAEESCATGFHRQIVLTSYSKVKIIHQDRFYQSLIDNLDSRLSANPELREFLDQIEPSKWSTTVESPWLEGEAKIKKLCGCFGMNDPAVKRAFRDYVDDTPSFPREILLLKSTIHTLPVSTGDCERGFSTMNVIATKCRNRLLVETVSNLLFLSLVGSPQSKCQPSKYVKEWLKCHRNVDDNRTKKVSDCSDANDMRMFCQFCELL